jgi:hypothetical protein
MTLTKNPKLDEKILKKIFEKFQHAPYGAPKKPSMRLMATTKTAQIVYLLEALNKINPRVIRTKKSLNRPKFKIQTGYIKACF